jgi:hypothetical protein
LDDTAIIVLFAFSIRSRMRMWQAPAANLTRAVVWSWMTLR